MIFAFHTPPQNKKTKLSINLLDNNADRITGKILEIEPTIIVSSFLYSSTASSDFIKVT
jgi:hypothetical protein